MGAFSLKKCYSVPLVAYDAPNVLFFLLHILQQFDLVVKLLNGSKAIIFQLDPFTYFTRAFTVHFDAKGLLPLVGLDPREQVDRENRSNFNGLQGVDHPVTVEVYGGAVRHAFVLEVEHFFPYAVAIVAKGLVEAFFLENTSLHFVEHLFFGHGFGLVLELVKVLFSLWQFGVAFAR